MNRFTVSLGLLLMAGLVGTTTLAAPIEPPKGALVRRNIDLAADQAFDSWVAQLQAAPHTDGIVTIGVLPLSGDVFDFTDILVAKLTALERFRVVILNGKEWDAIEEELARQDPDEGFGDIMDKATLAWKSMGEGYAISETTQGAQAILFGNFRDWDGDWLRARTRFSLKLGTVGTRELVAGGLVEGESILSIRDLVIYYKVELAGLAVGLVVLVMILRAFKGFTSKMSRPR